MAKFRAAHDSELGAGACLAVQAGGMDVVLFRHPDGTVTALEDRCSHAEVHLSGGTFENGEVECPAHGARFDARTGQNLCMPAVTPVARVEVRIENGEIFVVVPD